MMTSEEMDADKTVLEDLITQAEAEIELNPGEYDSVEVKKEQKQRDLVRMEIIMDLQLYAEQQIQNSRPSNGYDVMAYKRLTLVKLDANGENPSKTT